MLLSSVSLQLNAQERWAPIVEAMKDEVPKIVDVLKESHESLAEVNAYRQNIAGN